jgi:putative OPT family oligopeptide transporter
MDTPVESESNSRSSALPANAYRELRPGESYEPVVPARSAVAEVTGRSIAFGLTMTVVFSAAAAYVALKLGQGVESAIPIAILAIGFSALRARRSTLLENVNIVALGATAGVVVGGSVFVMPAIYVLHLEARSGFFQMFAVPLLGALLGVLFLLPFRRYFVADMHGKLPFPEATATTEILITGQRGGRHARVLLGAMGVGLVVDFLALNVQLWRDTFTTALVGRLRHLTEDVKAIFALNTSAAVLGLGYIIGVRYAAIICAGSFLSFFVLVPLFGRLGSAIPGEIFPGTPPLAGMDGETIFYEYVRFIGIGGIFAAGVISILKMSPVMAQALRRVVAELGRLGGAARRDAEVLRTERDLPMRWVGAGVIVLTVVLWTYFRLVPLSGVEGATGIATAAVALTLIVAFLFAAVSAWAVAMISITPVSGMTLTTLILAAVLLARLGLGGSEGMLATLLIGGVVCTALSMTGSMVTLLKIGYWIGATPRRIQLALMAGSVLASLTVTAVMMLFARTYGYAVDAAHPAPLPAPQANAMAAVVQTVMASTSAPWFLYGLGAVIAAIVELIGVSGLAFALGMYLPIDLNSPLLAGAILAWLVRRSTSDAQLARARANRGTLVASGLIAGGALAGVLDALVKFGQEEFLGRPLWSPAGFTGPGGNWGGLGVFVALSAWIYLDARRAAREEGTGPELSG